MLVWSLAAVFAGAGAGLLSAQTPPPIPEPQIATEQPALDSYFGKPVAQIKLSSETSPFTKVDEARIIDILPLRVGDTLTRAKLRAGLQALYSTLRFAEIQAEAQLTSEGLVLTFVTKPNFFISSIEVVGAPRPPTESQLANATKLELGQLFTNASADAGIRQMKRVLEDNGYYRAEITPHYVFDAPSQEAQVSFTVIPGEHARIGRVDVSGESGFTPEEVRGIAKMHPGDKVTTARQMRALQRLRKKYQKQHRLEAQVSIAKKAFDAQDNTVDYTFDIQRGPRVDIRVEGARIRSGLVKKYVPVYEENAVDDDLLNEGRRNLRDYLQTKGFFDAEITFTADRNPTGDNTTVVFNVDRGKEHKLVSLVIKGNRYFNTETIRERMRVQPASLFQYYGLYSQSLLARDVEAIENLYKANGFSEVKVESSTEDDVGGKRGHIRVTLAVSEGPQSLVQQLEITGNTTFTDEEVLDRI